MTLPTLHADVVPHTHDSALLSPTMILTVLAVTAIIGTAIVVLRKTSK